MSNYFLTVGAPESGYHLYELIVDIKVFLNREIEQGSLIFIKSGANSFVSPLTKQAREEKARPLTAHPTRVECDWQCLPV